MAKISDFDTTAPYEADYIEVKEILGKKITLLDCELFENHKGPGVHALIQLDGKEYRICTHGSALTDFLGRKEVKETLENGDFILCKIVEVKSKTGMTYPKLVDCED